MILGSTALGSIELGGVLASVSQPLQPPLFAVLADNGITTATLADTGKTSATITK